MIPALLALALQAQPPKQLACFAKYYALEPVQLEGKWFGKLTNGTEIPWDEGLPKTDDQRYEHPDLHDMLVELYPRGPIAPVNTVDADPGRIRVDSLFLATYGADAESIRKQLVPIDFLGETIRVHPRVAPHFRAVAARLAPEVKRDPTLRVYLSKLGGTFNWRPIARTDKLSAHSFGVSLDLNVAHSAYWQWQKPPEPITWRNEIPEVIVRAFEAEGFIWGGRWYHYDTMHFEYRPELLDPDCAL